MSEEQGFVRCTREDIYEFLGDRIVEPVRSALEGAGSGQCLRITSLPEEMLPRLWRGLSEDDRWIVRVLSVGQCAEPWEATATKLIEMRNSLEKPLLVLIPPDLRSAAEDSLGEATFSEISLASLPGSLSLTLLDSLSDSLRSSVDDILEYLSVEKVIRTDDQRLEFLLTVIKNGGDAASVGTSLFVFGLVPDRGLLGRPNPRQSLSLNRLAVEVLSDARPPIWTRISRLAIEPNSIQARIFEFLRGHRAEDPLSWTEAIATNPGASDLFFDKWPFAERLEGNSLRIIVENLGLPIQEADDVGGAAQLPVFDLDRRQGLKVTFRSTPPHAQVAAWKSFRIQILSIEGDETAVAWESNSYPKPAGTRRSVSRTLKVADLQILEEGTYYLKVDAYDPDGALLTDVKRVDEDDSSSRAENESDFFLVVRGGAEIEPPEPRAVTVPSAVDAWTASSVRAIGATDTDELPNLASTSGQWREASGAAVRGDVHFRLEGPGLAGYTVVMPGLLRKVELAILSNPQHLSGYRLNLAKRSLADVPVERSELSLRVVSACAERFIESRTVLFEAISDQYIHRDRNDGAEQNLQGVVEICDLFSLAGLIREYSRAYSDLLDEVLDQTPDDAKTDSLRTLANLDLSELRWRGSPGDPGRALVLAPTHPLRLTWHLAHAEFLRDLVEARRSGRASAASWPNLFKEARSGLLPLNLPMIVFDRRGRGYSEQGPLTPHWTLYLPDRMNGEFSIDTAATRDNARTCLGIRGARAQIGGISSQEIARRAFSYLVEGPIDVVDT